MPSSFPERSSDVNGGEARTGAQLAEKIATGYWNEVKRGNSKQLFLRSATPAAVGELVDRLHLRFQNDAPWLFQLDLQQQSPREACFPCLTLARSFVQSEQLDLDAVCDEANLYPAHRALFYSYLLGGHPQRAEEPIIDEIDYERSQMLRSLQGLLAHLSQTRPLIIALHNLQAGQIGLWRLLQAMLLQPEQGRVLLLASFANPAALQRSDEELNAWDDVVTSFGEHGVVVGLDGDFSHAASAPARVAHPPASRLADVLADCLDASTFLAFEEVIAWGAPAAHHLQEIGDEEHVTLARLLAVIGDAHHNLHSADEALIYYEQMLQIAQESGSDALLVEAYRRMALASMNKHDAISAVRYGQLAIGCASRGQDEALLFRALLALFIVEDKFTRTLEDAQYARLLDLASRHAGPSTTIYMLNMSYLYLSYYGNDFKRLIELNSEALALAGDYRNEFALAVGYHKRSIIYGLLDDYRNSLDCLRESEAIRSRLGNKLEVVRACNGIGYLCLMQDDYRRAYDYFTKAMQLFGNLRDYNEISMTLYNLASVYYRTGQYRIATHILDKVIQIMGILGITHIPFRDIASIYALKGICHFREGNWIKGTEWLSRIATMGSSQDAETRCYVGILQCHAAALEHDVHRINAIFGSVVEALSGHYKAHARLLPWAVLEFALILRQLGYQQNAQRQFDAAIALAEGSAMRRLAGWIRDEQREQPRQDAIELPDPGFDLDALVAFARQEVTLKKLHHVVRNMNFLNGLQTLLGRSADREVLGASFLRRVLGFCPAQLTALHMHGPDGWRLLAANPVGNGEQLTALVDRLQALGPSLFLDQARQQPGLQEFDIGSVINLQMGAPEQICVNLLVATCADGPSLGRSEKQVLAIALGQLVTVLEKLQHQEKLLYLSTIDELTALPNRKALRTQLKYELARVARYRQAGVCHLSVAFVDLDNFKFYNDSFGHAVGDMVLRAVVGLIRPCIRDTDYLARYGGDEFVLLLPETDAAQALQLTERIVGAVRRDSSLQRDIEQVLGRAVTIPPEKHLGCSVGIAQYQVSEHNLDIEEILLRADQALYVAKNGGKNQVSIWKADKA